MDPQNAHEPALLAFIAAFTVFALFWLHRIRTPSVSSKRPRKAANTFRVRGVPLEWDEARLRSFLAQDSSARPYIWSLAREVKGVTQTATVSFRAIPAPLQDLSTAGPWQLRIPGDSIRPQSIILDDSFLGLTTLFSPPLEDHKIDIIAISGLGGHAFGSFKEKNGDHMWLRDSLPHDLTNNDRPMARILAYGHESSVPNSNSFQNLEDLATGLHPSLRKLVAASAARPIIIIAHSLGGLIVKQICIILSRSKNDDDQKLLRAIYGIVFFGVPHDGMNIQSLIPMVGNQSNRFLIESIGHINSQVLSTQQREFQMALGGEGESEIICFYETVESPTAQKDRRGNWAMDGPKAILVVKSSATHCRPWENGPEHICAISRNHSGMVKFKLYDEEYDKAAQRLEGLARQALIAWNRKEALAAELAQVEPRAPRNNSESPLREQRESPPARSSGLIQLCDISSGNNSSQKVHVGPHGKIDAKNISAGDNSWQEFGNIKLHQCLDNIRQVQNTRHRDEEPGVQLVDECISGAIRR